MSAMKANWKGAMLVAGAALMLAAGCSPSPTEQDVEARTEALKTPLARFSWDCGRLPDRLDELLDSDRPRWKGPYVEDRKMLLDPWGHELIYVVNNESRFHSLQYLIVSAGPKGTVKAAEAEARSRLKALNMEAEAKERIRDLKKSVFASTMDNIVLGGDGSLPDSLQQLIDDGDLAVSPSFLLDPWGHEYIYSKEGKDGETCEIYSVGPDGMAGTSDDIHAKIKEDDEETGK